jgi:DNA mismatch repair protein MutL
VNKIRILPEGLRNKIAAGEVVERPASVVKELVENAIDAGGGRILVEIEDGGRRLIRVTDDGSGMAPDDARLSFERHATSKIGTEADLGAIRTLGFRGEALASIAAVARVRLVTAAAPSHAVEVRVEEGRIIKIDETAAPRGTRVEVADLFYNTPARKKFLKPRSTELTHILHLIQQTALAYPEIHFRLTHHGQELLDVPSVRTVRERALGIFGLKWLEQTLELSFEAGGLKAAGFISKPPFSFATRDHQHFFVNRRAIRSPLLTHAVTGAYDTSMMRARHPAALLFLEMPYEGLDVNVHPAKREVRFLDPQRIHDAVLGGLRERLRSSTGAPARPFFEAEVSFEVSNAGPASIITRESGETYPAFADPSPTIQEKILPSSVVAFGQIDRTYIVARVDGELHIVDQHAAHERLLFDRLMNQLKTDRLEVQPLLLTEPVDLPPALAHRLGPMQPILKDAGVEIEPLGPNSFVLRAVPALLGPVDPARFLTGLIEDSELEGIPGELSDRLKQIIATMACHGAVKAHQELKREEMDRLLADLPAATAPTCPHGRPIRVALGRSDLEKMFRRK